ncbi:MAG: hypothetical protein ACK47B_11235 [Armatimonadota bacterium]
MRPVAVLALGAILTASLLVGCTGGGESAEDMPPVNTTPAPPTPPGGAGSTTGTAPQTNPGELPPPPTQ